LAALWAERPGNRIRDVRQFTPPLIVRTLRSYKVRERAGRSAGIANAGTWKPESDANAASAW
jgi:hypothetical protein